MEPNEKPQHILFLEAVTKEFSQYPHVEFLVIARISSTGSTMMRPSNPDFGWIFGQLKIAKEWFTMQFRGMNQGVIQEQVDHVMAVKAAMNIDPGGKAN